MDGDEIRCDSEVDRVVIQGRFGMMIRNDSHTAKALAMYVYSNILSHKVCAYETVLALGGNCTTLCFPLTLPFLPDLWLNGR
jgi:hypothetical protein